MSKDVIKFKTCARLISQNAIELKRLLQLKVFKRYKRKKRRGAPFIKDIHLRISTIVKEDKLKYTGQRTLKADAMWLLKCMIKCIWTSKKYRLSNRRKDS